MFRSNNKNIVSFFQNLSLKNLGEVLMFCCLLFCSFSGLQAQYSVSPNDDSDIEWREIKTDRFHLIYPNFYEANAQRMAVVLDTLYPYIGSSLGTDAPNIPFLIHTNSSKSNGLTVWAPKRIELWTTPSPTSFAYPWSWHLAIHEYRHACQMQALDKGVSGVLNNIFGEHILGAVAGLLIPMWFMEGDAVVAETALTPSGRGATPDFKMQMKAHLLEQGAFSYDKAILGSRKSFVPNEYVLGYYMCAYSRNIYGKDIFADITESTARNWWSLNWFSRADIRGIKYDESRIYSNLTDSLANLWGHEDNLWLASADKSCLDTIQIRKDYYTNYLNPVKTGKDSIIALKSSYFDLQSLVLIHNGKEEKLRSLPFLKHSFFDYHNGKILYSQEAMNQRWGQQNYSDIVEYDIKNRKYRMISSKGIFFNPVYNPVDPTLIAAIETDNRDNQSLVVLNTSGQFEKTKNILKQNRNIYIRSVSNQNATTLSYPTWSEDGRFIFVIETNEKGKLISRYNIYTMEREVILQTGYDNISHLKQKQGKLFFLKDMDSKYEIVCMDLDTRNTMQLSETQFGVGDFHITDSTRMIVCPYSSMGYYLAETDCNPKPTNLFKRNREAVFVDLIRKEENFILSDQTLNFDSMKYESRPYEKIAHLFNFHSWAPIYMNISKMDFGVGASVFSQNLLSTSVLELGYKYNFNDTKNELYMNYTYSGLYPIIQFEGNYKTRWLTFDTGPADLYAKWNELMMGFDISLPYSWNTQQSVNSVKLRMNYSVRKLIPKELYSPGEEIKILDIFNTMGIGLNVSSLSATAYNDLAPRFGFNAMIAYKSTLTENPAEYFAAKVTTYLPAFTKNQSFELALTYQTNSPNKYYFPTEISFTKGIHNLSPKEFYGFGITFHTPLSYPDWKLGSILYVKRVIARPFYEVGWFDKTAFQSFGSDISFNLHLLRIHTPLETGFRIGYLTERNTLFFNLLFSLDL